MTVSDIYAAQIEAHFFFYIALGASTTCLCLTMYICAKMMIEALHEARLPHELTRSAQRGIPQTVPIIWTPQGRHSCERPERPEYARYPLGRISYMAQYPRQIFGAS